MRPVQKMTSTRPPIRKGAFFQPGGHKTQKRRIVGRPAHRCNVSAASVFVGRPEKPKPHAARTLPATAGTICARPWPSHARGRTGRQDWQLQDTIPRSPMPSARHDRRHGSAARSICHDVTPACQTHCPRPWRAQATSDAPKIFFAFFSLSPKKRLDVLTLT